VEGRIVYAKMLVGGLIPRKSEELMVPEFQPSVARLVKVYVISFRNFSVARNTA